MSKIDGTHSGPAMGLSGSSLEPLQLRLGRIGLEDSKAVIGDVVSCVVASLSCSIDQMVDRALAPGGSCFRTLEEAIVRCLSQTDSHSALIAPHRLWEVESDVATLTHLSDSLKAARSALVESVDFRHNQDMEQLRGEMASFRSQTTGQLAELRAHVQVLDGSLQDQMRMVAAASAAQVQQVAAFSVSKVVAGSADTGTPTEEDELAWSTDDVSKDPYSLGASPTATCEGTLDVQPRSPLPMAPDHPALFPAFLSRHHDLEGEWLLPHRHQQACEPSGQDRGIACSSPQHGPCLFTPKLAPPPVAQGPPRRSVSARGERRPFEESLPTASCPQDALLDASCHLRKGCPSSRCSSPPPRPSGVPRDMPDWVQDLEPYMAERMRSILHRPNTQRHSPQTDRWASSCMPAAPAPSARLLRVMQAVQESRLT